MPEEVHRDLEVAYQDERPIIARFARERGFNSRTTKFEMAPYKAAEISPLGGILIDEFGQTSLPGLYAAGDVGCKVCYEICPMDVFGWDEEKGLPVVLYER